VQYDFAWYSATPLLQFGPGGTGPFNDGANLRRGRLYVEGTLTQALDYKFELEFFNGLGFSPAGTTGAVQFNSVTNSPGPTDAWLTVKDVPLVGNVRIGSQKEWFSLEHLNSYRFLEFMERSYLFDFSQPTAFNNGFSPGVSAFRTWANDRVFTAIGAYKNDSDLLGFGLGDGRYAVTGRVAALPVWMPDERVFWHVGGAMSHRDPVNGQVQIRLRDNIRNAPFPLLNLVANTGLIDTSSQDLFNLETAAVMGPFTFQAEYTANVLNGARIGTGPPQGDLFFQGYYAEGLVFLTGESRTWNTKNFFFNRVKPRRPLRLKPSDCEGYGFGAWELGVRYTCIDLANKAVQAGRLDSVTLGLNWYLTDHAKVQFNYDYTQRVDTPAHGHIHAFGTRCAFDF
jgi:phosphate-selective porin OprO/OprP